MKKNFLCAAIIFVSYKFKLHVNHGVYNLGRWRAKNLQLFRVLIDDNAFLSLNFAIKNGMQEIKRDYLEVLACVIQFVQ